MHHPDPRRDPAGRGHLPRLAGSPVADAAPASHGAAPAPATICLAAAALLVEARFREITLAARLLRADRPGRFTIGPGRGADAPVNPAWLTDAADRRPHPLVERTPAGFVVALTPAMKAQLWTSHQRLPLRPDAGRAEGPLDLPPDAHLRIACGEITFELRGAEVPAALPRPVLPAGWRSGLRYPVGVALALAALLGLVHLVPSDPRALSLDVLGADRRLDRTVVIPLDIAAPAIDRALQSRPAPAKDGRAAAGPSGQAGARQAPHRDSRLAIAGATKTDARQAAAGVRSVGVLSLLNGQTSPAVADVLTGGPAMGADAQDVLGHLQGVAIADAAGTGSLGVLGSGAAAAGTGERTLGVGALETRGRFGGVEGSGRYGDMAGVLRRRTPRPPEVTFEGTSVRGSLDKEIIRRTVRRHLNEVRYCYENALAAHPALSGRVVVQFTIGPTGRVLVGLLQSSTLGAPSVEACVVGAVRRWEFPQPAGGGLVAVTYPFALSPAGR
jgi:TonB family protein